MITIRPARRDDGAVWRGWRHTLWPEGSLSEHQGEIDRYFAGTFPREPWMTLLAESVEGVLGFAEVSIRPYAEGCRTSRVGYLEGWFVVPEARKGGVGRALVAGAEEWARSQGCTEFASDADPANEDSVAAHRALGFVDVGLVRCFRKDL